MDFLLELCERYQSVGKMDLLDLLDQDERPWQKLDLCQFHVHELMDCKGRAVKSSVTEETKDGANEKEDAKKLVDV